MLKCSIYNNIIPGKNDDFEIYNSMTKARISVKDKDFLNNVVESGSDEATLEVLKENGFIVDKNLDEVSALRYVYNKRYFNSSSLGIIMLPTMSCNFDCPYCFEKPSAHIIGTENPNYFQIIERFCGDTNVIHVLPDLSLWKCVNDLSFKEAQVGELNEDGIAEWDTNKVLAWYRNADFLQDEKCIGCSIAPDCLGGCIRNFILTGNHRCCSLSALSLPYQY